MILHTTSATAADGTVPLTCAGRPVIQRVLTLTGLRDLLTVRQQ